MKDWQELRDKIKKTLDLSWTKKEYQTTINKARLFLKIYRRKTKNQSLDDILMTEEEQKEADIKKAKS